MDQQPPQEAPADQAPTDQPSGQPGADPRTVMHGLTLAVMKLVFDPNAAKTLAQAMQGGGDPAQAVAKAADSVLQQVATASKGKGIPFDAYVALGPAAVAFLCQLATAAKIFNADSAVAQQAIKLLHDTMTADDQQGDKQVAAQQPPPGPGGGLIQSQMPN